MIQTFGENVRAFFPDLGDPDVARDQDRARAVLAAFSHSDFYVVEEQFAESAELYLSKGPMGGSMVSTHTLAEAYCRLLEAFGQTAQIDRGDCCVDPSGVATLQHLEPSADNGLVVISGYEWVNCPVMGEVHPAFSRETTPTLWWLQWVQEPDGFVCLRAPDLDLSFYKAPEGHPYEWTLDKGTAGDVTAGPAPSEAAWGSWVSAHARPGEARSGETGISTAGDTGREQEKQAPAANDTGRLLLDHPAGGFPLNRPGKWMKYCHWFHHDRADAQQKYEKLKLMHLEDIMNDDFESFSFALYCFEYRHAIGKWLNGPAIDESNAIRPLYGDSNHSVADSIGANRADMEYILAAYISAVRDWIVEPDDDSGFWSFMPSLKADVASLQRKNEDGGRVGNPRQVREKSTAEILAEVKADNASRRRTSIAEMMARTDAYIASRKGKRGGLHK
ncbi:hypothetical protein ACFQ78_41380 [Streptomyces sp. NPDC056519]|uniref:hypothetical protein n=1 Tax=Streptomyces sp. NPDC056519 TaxID=3345849 RepID=UPI00367CEC59